jgi:DNA modification methylase
VFEPFLGSGTTLIAAEKEGMCCLGFELDCKFATVVIDRWEKLTGQTAELIGQL